MNFVSKLSLGLLIVITACKDAAEQQPAVENEIDKVKLTDLKGQLVNLDEYKGKTIFINFWATWCKPCREEMPSIQKAMEIMKDGNIEFYLLQMRPKNKLKHSKQGMITVLIMSKPATLRN